MKCILKLFFTSRKAGQHVLLVQGQGQGQVQVTFSFFGNFGTPQILGPPIPGNPTYTGTPHAWGPGDSRSGWPS